MLEPLIFICTPIAIYDADGPIWCAEGPRIRVAAVAGREMDGECLPNHPCPDMAPDQARRRVVGVMRGKITGTMSTGHLKIEAPAMTCRWLDRSGKRVVADCTLSDGGNLSCESIATKAVADWPRYRRQYGLPGCGR